MIPILLLDIPILSDKSRQLAYPALVSNLVCTKFYLDLHIAKYALTFISKIFAIGVPAPNSKADNNAAEILLIIIFIAHIRKTECNCFQI